MSQVGPAPSGVQFTFQPIITPGSGGGLACPPFSNRSSVANCTPTLACTSCNNLVRDAGESDIDCGGTSACGPCDYGRNCTADTDCAAAASLVCLANVCTPSWFANTSVFVDGEAGLRVGRGEKRGKEKLAISGHSLARIHTAAHSHPS